MQTKSRRLLSTLLTLIMVLSLIPAFTITASAKTIKVTTTEDNASDPVVNSLRAAILSAETGDEITFDISVDDTGYSEDDGTWRIVLESEIQIATAITINGGGNVIIDGDDKFRIFNYAGSEELTLIGLRITNGNASEYEDNEYGGGIYAHESDLTLTDCVFIGNTAEFGGGAYVDTGKVRLNGCTFEDNAASFGGSVYVENGDVIATNCKFTDNAAVYSGGGVYAKKGNVAAEHCNFTGNTAGTESGTGDGGGVYSGGDVFAEDCTFAENKAYRGGGIYAVMAEGVGGNIEVTLCTFEDNAAAFGGGVYSEGFIIVTGAVFTGNTANDGGGIYSGDAVLGIGCEFTGNAADGEKFGVGGGVFSVGSAVAVSCVFTGNVAYGGGGVYVSGVYKGIHPAVLINCVFSKNETMDNNSGTVKSNMKTYLYHTTVAGNIGNGVYSYTANIALVPELYAYNSIIVGSSAAYGTNEPSEYESYVTVTDGDSLIEGIDAEVNLPALFGANSTDEYGVMKPMSGGLADGTAVQLTEEDITAPEGVSFAGIPFEDTAFENLVSAIGDIPAINIIHSLMWDIQGEKRAAESVNYGAVEATEGGIGSVEYVAGSLKKAPDSYKVGDALDLTDGKLKVTYDYGSSLTRDGFVSLDDPNVTYSGFNSTAVGEKEVTFTYFGQTDKVMFTISANPDSPASTPKNSVISSETVTAQRGEDGKNEDITITLTGNGNTLNDITNNGEKLERGKDYTIDGDKVTIKGEYLDSLVPGEYTFTFDMNRGTDPKLIATVTWDNPFIDVDVDDWFYSDVEYVFINGLFNGTSADMFSPNLPMTRAMLVTVLWRLDGSPEVAEAAGFTDIEKGSYYEAAVAWAAANGIINGYGNGLFGFDDNITREQVATILERYMNYKGITFSGTMEYKVFSDSADISEWAEGAIQLMSKMGVINGKPGDIFDPKGTATRAEIAAIIHRFCENVLSK